MIKENLSKENPFFDDIVIGSSPMMLLQASILASEGRKVCLVDREVNLGGSWQIATLENGERVEIACHVIECIPDVYNFLQSKSGVEFVPLEAQPIRVLPSGMIFKYLSRFQLFGSGIRLIVGLIIQRFKNILGLISDQNRLINFQTKLKSYLRFQIKAFFHDQIMYGPKKWFC